MSLQTGVLINGAWTTRTMDLQTILAKNQEEDAAARPAVASTAKAPDPSLGILTRTIIPSPVLRWIIPARIRHRDKNDVLFIGDHFIQVKELSFSGSLTNVICKIDFDQRIRHARVIGMKPDSSEMVWDYIKTEDSKTQQHPAARAEEDKIILPPQVLVVALEHQELMYLWVHESRNGVVRCVTVPQTLPVQRSPVEQVANHIAVDPKSRAMAVSGRRNSLVIYALHPFAHLRETLDGSSVRSCASNFDPVQEERYFVVHGDILQMEFLYPAPNDDHHVILLLIVHKDSKTRMVIFEWDSSQSLRMAKRQGPNGHRVPEIEKMPILLIPLTIASAFILVTEKLISLYTGILAGPPTRNFVGDLVLPKSAKDMGTLSGHPLYTAWARPVRTEQYSSTRDDFYLCREDGHVGFIQASEDKVCLLRNELKAGDLRGYVGTAFAALDLGVDRCDLLVVGGEGCPGGVYVVGASSLSPSGDGSSPVPQFHETVPNWAPATDFVTIGATGRALRSSPEGSESRSPYRQDRVFACTGRGSFGAVSELRNGIHGLIHILTPYVVGANEAWGLPDYAGRGMFMLFSFPTCSELLWLSGDGKDVEMKQEDDCGGLALDSSTLTVGEFKNCVVQVTATSIRTTSFADFGEYEKVPACSTDCGPNEVIVKAALESAEGLILFVTKVHEEFKLHVTNLVDSERGFIAHDLVEPMVLVSEPTSFSARLIENGLCILVGTTKRTLQIFRYHPDSGIVPVIEHAFDGFVGGDEAFAICESSVLLDGPNRRAENPEQTTSSWRIICGLRNGFLVVVEFYLASESELVAKLYKQYQIGSTSVTVTADDRSTTRAFIRCGREFCQLRADQTHCSISNIWLTSSTDALFHQGDISAVSRIFFQPHLEKQLAQAIFCVSNGNVVLAELGEDMGIVPRHMEIVGTPRKLLYLPRLDHLIVAYTRVVTSAAFGDSSTRGSRQAISTVGFVHPDSGLVPYSECQIALDGTSPDDCTPTLGRATESINDMIEWIFKKNGYTYHYVVLATGTKENTKAQGAGRIILLCVKREFDGNLSLKQKNAFSGNGPMRSVAVYSSDSLITSCGNEIVIRRLEAEDRFVKVASYSLRERCTSISVENPFVRLTTAGDSLVNLIVENNQFKVIFNDILARNGSSHLAIPGQNIVLASSSESSLTGIGKVNTRQIQSAAQIIFEAEMTSSISKLRFSSIRPPWRWPVKLPGLVEYQHDTIRDKEIVGLCTNGSFVHVSLLREPAWRLLRHIQDLGLTRTFIPAAPGWKAMRRVKKPRPSGQISSHVNGDLLSRYLDFSSADLHEMVENRPFDKGSTGQKVSFQIAQRRGQQFAELLGAAIEVPITNAYDQALNYLSDLLQPAF